jgi:hypothetical protein
METENKLVIVKIGKILTKCVLNPKRKLKYKIGIGRDGQQNSALKQKIMPARYG